MPEQKNTIPKTSVRVLLPVAVAGLAFLWAWVLLFVFVAPGPALGGIYAVPRAIGFFAGAALCSGAIVARGASSSHIHPLRSALGGFLGTVPASAIQILSNETTLLTALPPTLSVSLSVAASALAGVSFAWCLASYADLLSIEWRRDVGARYGFAMAAAAVVAFVLAHVSLPIQPSAVAALPLLAYAVLIYLKHHVFDQTPSPSEREGERIEFFRITGLTVVAYGALFGMVVGFIMAQPASDAFLTLTTVAVAVGALAQNVLSRALKRYLPFGWVEKAMLVLLVVGFLAVLFAPPAFHVGICLVLVALLVCFDLADLSALTALASTDRARSVRYLARGRLSIPLGLAAGIALEAAVRAVDPGPAGTFPTALASAALGLLLVLALVAVFVPVKDNTVAEVVTHHRSADSLFELRCAEVSDRFKLSARESQVLVYLARGRNAEYIGNRLCISTYTAKAHIYHIYRKMGVNAQAELMDIVEQCEVPLV